MVSSVSETKGVAPIARRHTMRPLYHDSLLPAPKAPVLSVASSLQLNHLPIYCIMHVVASSRVFLGFKFCLTGRSTKTRVFTVGRSNPPKIKEFSKGTAYDRNFLREVHVESVP
jgi:hypothetical protein